MVSMKSPDDRTRQIFVRFESIEGSGTRETLSPPAFWGPKVLAKARSDQQSGNGHATEEMSNILLTFKLEHNKSICCTSDLHELSDEIVDGCVLNRSVDAKGR